VLDIGCGCGEIARKLIAQAEASDHRLTLIDHQEMLDLVPMSKAVTAVAGRFPDDMPPSVEGGGFDVIIAYSVLHVVVVKSLAKLMGGDLTVTSTPGRGSAFRFSAVLPVAAAAAPGGARAAPMQTAARRLAVLCAEDNPYGRVILNTILTELGHRADFVSTGDEAVDAVKRGYDVVLMDVTLPGIDGLEATRRIRALSGAAGGTPIVGISGRGESGDETAARAAGMNAYLRKPLSPSALSEAIAAVVT
jgi:CheY-like chemotaxis protein